MKKTRFNKISKKINIWVNRKIFPKESRTTSRTEREVLSIFTNLLKQPDSELLMYMDGKYYIKSAKTDMLVTLNKYQNEISITNHVYGYNVNLNDRILNSMIKKFINEVEYRRIKMEEDRVNNIQCSLSIIAKTIKKQL